MQRSPGPHRPIPPRAGWRRRVQALVLCLAILPYAADAQVPDGDLLRGAGLNPDSLQPMPEAQHLSIRGAPPFRFAIELVNLGLPVPGAPARILAEGTGAAHHGLRTTFWRLQFTRLTVDRQVLSAMAPLASVDVDVATDNPIQRSFTASYRGMDSTVAPGNVLRAFVVQIATIAAHGVLVPPARPVAPNGLVYDISEAVNQALQVSFGGAQLVAPIAPATAAGLIEVGRRDALLARLAGSTVARTAQGDVPLRVDGFAAIDRRTGLALLTRTRFSGVAQLASLRGPVDMTITFVIVPEGTGDAVAALPPSPQLMTGTAPPIGTPGAGTERMAPVDSPPPGLAPPPRPAAKPPAAKPAVTPKPQAAPAGDRPAAPAAAGDVARRLEQLKSLFDRGLITKEQYEAKQKEILGAL